MLLDRLGNWATLRGLPFFIGRKKQNWKLGRLVRGGKLRPPHSVTCDANIESKMV